MIRLLFFSLMISSAFNSLAQDTIYLDAKWQETTIPQEMKWTRVLSYDKEDSNAATERTYYPSGSIYGEIFYSSYKERTRKNVATFWYDEGGKQLEIHYLKGKKHGAFISYWRNGNIKRKEIWKKGKLKSGTCWNKEGNKVPYYDFEVLPEFPGGTDALISYIKKNMKYPSEAAKAGVGGNIIVKFSVDTTGQITDIKVGEGNYYLKMEAYRLVKQMPRWSPGYKDGEAVRVFYALPLTFRP